MILDFFKRVVVLLGNGLRYNSCIDEIGCHLFQLKLVIFLLDKYFVLGQKLEIYIVDFQDCCGTVRGNGFSILAAVKPGQPRSPHP